MSDYRKDSAPNDPLSSREATKSMDDVFGVLERAGVIEQLCPRCGGPLGSGHAIVTVSWTQDRGLWTTNSVICNDCRVELRGWLGVVRRRENSSETGPKTS